MLSFHQHTDSDSICSYILKLENARCSYYACLQELADLEDILEDFDALTMVITYQRSTVLWMIFNFFCFAVLSHWSRKQSFHKVVTSCLAMYPGSRWAVRAWV